MEPQASASSQYSPSGSHRSWPAIAILVLLLIAAIAFGAWAFLGRQDYKTNSDQKAAAAVAAAKKAQAAQLQAQFDQTAKSPFKTFHGSPTYGSVSFKYPKTWSAYVETDSSSEPINAYFFPDQVPGTQSKTAYALRVELVNTDYSQLMRQFDSEIKQGKITAAAYIPPKLKGVANAQPGTLLSGQINSGDSSQQGIMLAIKVRDKTLKIYTESSDFADDFNGTILNSLTFAP